MMNFSKAVLVILSFYVMVSSALAQNIPDWQENGSNGSCGWAKSDKSGKSLPISIYANPSDTSPIKTINNDPNYYWVVEKKGNWVKLRATGGPQFLNGPLVGWVKISQLQLGAFRNCN